MVCIARRKYTNSKGEDTMIINDDEDDVKDRDFDLGTNDEEGAVVSDNINDEDADDNNNGGFEDDDVVDHNFYVDDREGKIMFRKSTAMVVMVTDLQSMLENHFGGNNDDIAT